jgi:hypothetical protein
MARRTPTGIALVALGSTVLGVTGLLVLAGGVPAASSPGVTLAVIGVVFLALGGYFLTR